LNFKHIALGQTNKVCSRQSAIVYACTVSLTLYQYNAGGRENFEVDGGLNSLSVGDTEYSDSLLTLH